MNQTVFMCVLDANCGLTNHFTRITHLQSAISISNLKQIATIHKLHRQIMLALILTGVSCPHNVGMIEPANGFHFTIESRNGLWIMAQVLGQHFDRNHHFQSRMLRQIYLAHSAFAKQFQESIGAQHCPAQSNASLLIRLYRCIISVSGWLRKHFAADVAQDMLEVGFVIKLPLRYPIF